MARGGHRAARARSSRTSQLEHVLVDNAAMQLVAAPRHFDVIVTENMFGDILSDEAAMLTGSIGMLPSASLGDRRARACSSRCTARRPTSPDRAIANPLAMFLSVALMLRHGLDSGSRGRGGRIGRRPRPGRGPAHAPTWAGRRRTAEATQAVLEHL